MYKHRGQDVDWRVDRQGSQVSFRQKGKEICDAASARVQKVARQVAAEVVMPGSLQTCKLCWRSLKAIIDCQLLHQQQVSAALPGRFLLCCH